MPAPIISGLVTYLGTELDITVWEGEIPRLDASQQPMELTATSPLYKVVMPEEGLTREWNFSANGQYSSYSDSGNMTIYIWATTRSQCEELITDIEEQMNPMGNVQSVPLSSGASGTPSSTWQLFKFTLMRWTCVHLEGMRTAQSQFIYEGRMNYDVGIHGVCPG